MGFKKIILQPMVTPTVCSQPHTNNGYVPADLTSQDSHLHRPQSFPQSMN